MLLKYDTDKSQHKEYHRILGCLYVRWGFWSKADPELRDEGLAHYEQAIELAPQDCEIRSEFGENLERMDKMDWQYVNIEK